MYRSTSFSQLPEVVKNLLIINGLFFLAQLTFTDTLENYLGLHAFQSPDFNIYQLITYGFLHADPYHLLFNMFPVFMFGKELENTWGSKRFLNYYLLTVIGAGIVQLIVGGFGLTIGASGGVFGLLVGFGMLFPNTLLYIYFAIPVKAKYFVIGYAILELFAGIRSAEEDNVAHFAHLGGAFFGFLIIKYWQKDRNTFY